MNELITAWSGSETASHEVGHIGSQTTLDIMRAVVHVQRRYIEVKSPQVTLELPDMFVNHRVLVTMQTLDDGGDRSQPAPLTADGSEQLLAETRGAWGHQSLAQVDALLAERRRADWGDE